MRELKIIIWFIVSGMAFSMKESLFLKDFLEAVDKERSISTLLVMQRKVQRRDILQGLYPLPWPIMRLDETQTIELVNYYNKEFLAMVYMETQEDIVLLSSLAANFNHMREARIMIWIELNPSKKFRSRIANHADKHKFLNLLIIEKSLQISRFYPFSQPRINVIEQPKEERELFPVLWRNFMGKTAVTIPDLVPPRSFFLIDPKTGQKRHGGYMHKIITSFAKTYNITLEMKMPINESVSQVDIIEKTIKGEIDLPLTAHLVNMRHPNESRKDSFLGITTLSILVPCGEEMTVYERLYLVYGLTTVITMILSYILMSIIDVLFGILCDRIKRNPSRFKVLNVIFNLRVLACILSMSIPKGNRLRSVLGQLTVVMSFTGLLWASILAAQTSTLLTMSPQYRHSMNFRELRKSNITVVFNRLNYMLIKRQMEPEFFKTFLPNIWIVKSQEQMNMITSLNTSYAYHTFTYKKDPSTMIQRHSRRKALCRAPELDMVSGLTHSAVLEQNSVYALALREFTFQAWSTGLSQHWLDEAIMEMKSSTRYTQLPFTTGFKAMNLPDYRGNWQILIVGLTLACCVFAAEVSLGYLKRKK